MNEDDLFCAFSGDFIEHVVEVNGDGASSWGYLMGMGRVIISVDVFVDFHIDGIVYKVGATFKSYGVVVGEEVF